MSISSTLGARDRESINGCITTYSLVREIALKNEKIYKYTFKKQKIINHSKVSERRKAELVKEAFME